jgi:hypothetical protein
LATNALQQTLSSVVFTVAGPSAPTGAINATISGINAQIRVNLPSTPGQIYVVAGIANFNVDGLALPDGEIFTGSAAAQSLPQQITWSGRSSVARFGIVFDSINDVFVMRFEGLFGT